MENHNTSFESSFEVRVTEDDVKNILKFENSREITPKIHAHRVDAYIQRSAIIDNVEGYSYNKMVNKWRFTIPRRTSKLSLAHKFALVDNPLRHYNFERVGNVAFPKKNRKQKFFHVTLNEEKEYLFLSEGFTSFIKREPPRRN